jgi:hypothetical protein
MAVRTGAMKATPGLAPGTRIVVGTRTRYGNGIRLAARPLTLRQANAYVAAHHRHHGPARGMKFAIGAVELEHAELIVGVVIVGRPKARLLDDGLTAEVTRLCTDGEPNAASFLLGAAWRAARAMGYRRMVSYLLPDELGASYAAAGWRRAAESPGGEWYNPRRTDARFTRGREPLAGLLGLGAKHPEGPKVRWEVSAT